MIRRAALMIACAVALCVYGCGRRGHISEQEETERKKEIDLFLGAIRLVQERYVDIDRVQLDRIISNSLRGAVTSVDPYAQIYYTGTKDETAPPKDVPLIEISPRTEIGPMIVRVFAFTEDTRKEARRIEASLRNRDPDGILIDCRGSYGNDYAAAATVAEWFLPRGARIGALATRPGEPVEEFISKRPPLWATNTVIVLTDNTLAGPAEFLAAALRANNRCLLVGQPSRGVAVIQTPVKLTDDWTVLLSTGGAQEPGGRPITGNPIVPDIVAQPEPGNVENVDWVYLRGIAVLRDQHALDSPAP